jgi:hypothetical protein
MANKIQIRRGLKANLPTLSVGEPAFVTDAGAEEIYIGTGTKNVQFARQDQMLAALDNKVEGKWTIYTSLADVGITPGTETIIDIVGAMADSSILILFVNAGTGANPNNPTEYPVKTGTLTIVKSNMARVYIDFSGSGNAIVSVNERWIASYYDSASADPPIFSGWKKIATVEASIENALPLASGFTVIYNSTYRKNQFNEVSVTGALRKSSGTLANNILATLPAGYRPATEIRVSATMMASAAALIGEDVIVSVKPDGTITLVGSGGTDVYFSFSFVAI